MTRRRNTTRPGKGNLTDKLAAIVATFFGAGLSPKAPGTVGTIAAIPVVYFTNTWPLLWRIALWSGLFLLGVWAATRYDRQNKSADNQRIVIDEVVGYGITAWVAGTEWINLLAAFILFRAFDILKPPPIRQIDKWSKKMRNWSGFGVMIDDVLAGIMGLIIFILLRHEGFLF